MSAQDYFPHEIFPTSEDECEHPEESQDHRTILVTIHPNNDPEGMDVSRDIIICTDCGQVLRVLN